MARVQFKMPDEILQRLSQLGERTDEIIPRVLAAGGEVVLARVKGNLSAVVGKGDKRPRRPTGELVSALGVSPAKLDREGNFNLKIGFAEPRSGGGNNALIANVIETYGSPVMLAKAIKADLTIELAEAILYADDSAAYVVKDFKSGKLSLGVDDIGVTAAQDLTGAAADDNGVLIYAGENEGNLVAVGFRALKPDNRYRYFWLYRVKFGIPATNLQTKGDSITFQTPTIEGTVVRRNKPDIRGKHPWKAEVTEGDTGVSPTTITGWYTQVYEPDFTGGE